MRKVQSIHFFQIQYLWVFVKDNLSHILNLLSIDLSFPSQFISFIQIPRDSYDFLLLIDLFINFSPHPYTYAHCIIRSYCGERLC
jgi:hypothetical protein